MYTSRRLGEVAVRRALDHIRYSGRQVKMKIQVGTEFSRKRKCQELRYRGSQEARKDGGSKMATIKLGYAPTRRSIFSAPDAIKYRGLTADRLKELGISIIYVSHRMEELFRLGDRVTVLRDGEYVGTKNLADVTEDDLVQMMVGRAIEEHYGEHEVKEEVVLEVKGLSRGRMVQDVSFFRQKRRSRGNRRHRRRRTQRDSQGHRRHRQWV